MKESLGTVLKSTGSRYQVILDNGDKIEAVIKGKFRLEGNRSTNPIAVGDRVKVDLEEDSEIITEILPRRNHIKRRSINLSKESHILAANIDQVFIVVTLAVPVTPIEFIDRVLLNAESYGIQPIILFNKSDLYTPADLDQYYELKSTYSKIGYPCMLIDAISGDIKELKSMLLDKTTFFVGQSGVGKSTLINRIQPGLDIKTNDVSFAYETGKHTTTFAEMFPLNFGGYIIDSPGVKAFGILDLEKEEVALYFPEMKSRLEHCKFYNCKHINEPKCAVKAALETGDISQSRYRSYLSIYEDCELDNNYRKPDHLK